MTIPNFFEIQNKVTKNDLIPLKEKADKLKSSLTQSDYPSKLVPRGTQRYREYMRGIKLIEKKQSQIEKALLNKRAELERRASGRNK